MGNFANNLRDARRKKKITQKAAAQAAGISQPLWSDYERRRKSPSIEQAERLAAAIGSTLRKLV